MVLFAFLVTSVARADPLPRGPGASPLATASDAPALDAELAAVDGALARLRALRIDGGTHAATASQRALNATLTKQLAEKVQALQGLERITEPATDAPTSHAVALLLRRAEALEDVRVAILRSYVPSYLTEDQRELYSKALKDKSAGFATRGLAVALRALAMAEVAPELPIERQVDILRLRTLSHRAWRGSAPATGAVTEGGRARLAALAADARRRTEDRARRAVAERDEAVAAAQTAIDAAPPCVSSEHTALARAAIQSWAPLASAEHSSEALEEATFLLQGSLYQLEVDWSCAGAPPSALGRLARIAFIDRHAGGLPDWVEPTRLKGLASSPTQWSPTPVPAPPVGNVVDVDTLAARVLALRAWMNTWTAALAAPEGTPNRAELDSIARHIGSRSAAMRTLEADAAAVLRNPATEARARVWLADARVDEAAARIELLARLDGARTPVGGDAERWLAWAIDERRRVVARETYAALDAVDAWLDPLFARGWPMPIHVSEEVRAEAARVQARSLDVAVGAFPIQVRPPPP